MILQSSVIKCVDYFENIVFFRKLATDKKTELNNIHYMIIFTEFKNCLTGTTRGLSKLVTEYDAFTVNTFDLLLVILFVAPFIRLAKLLKK